jgi:hypothetical protein
MVRSIWKLLREFSGCVERQSRELLWSVPMVVVRELSRKKSYWIAREFWRRPHTKSLARDMTYLGLSVMEGAVVLSSLEG